MKQSWQKATVTGGVLLSVLVSGGPATVQAAGDGASDYTVKWKSGLRVESPDKEHKVKIGGRLQYDWTWASDSGDIEDDVGKLEDGSETRRARFYVSGTLYENVDFKLQYDWAGGDASLKDAYIALNNLPTYLKIGHFKEPFSLEELTSSKYGTFMERTPVVTVFSPSRNAGVGLSSGFLDDNATYAFGVFRNTDGQGKTTDEDVYSVTARLTGTPVYEDGGKRLVHLGAAGSYRTQPDALRYRARPPMHKTVRFVDTRGSSTDPVTGESVTKDLAGDEAWLWGVEAATVLGSLSLQGEFIGINDDLDDGSSFDGLGWYVQASYLLTGEHRPYKKSSGTFSNIKPQDNYGEGGGWGAWELAVRYDSLDLNDGDVNGGELEDTAVGLNWYLNPAIRLTANYVYSDLDNSGEAHFVGTRAQVAF